MGPMTLSVGCPSRTLITAELRELRLPERLKSEHTDVAADILERAAKCSPQPSYD